MPLPILDPLHGPRISLRPVAETDLPELFEINGDDEVTRFLPYNTWTQREDGVAWFHRMQALAASGSGRQLVVVHTAQARVIGSALLFHHDEGSRRVELGYVLGRAYWRQGLMREALTVLCGHAFGSLGIRRIEAEVNPANIGSNQLLLALGFQREGTLRRRWVAKGQCYDTHFYGCLADEWPARAPAATLPPGV